MFLNRERFVGMPPLLYISFQMQNFATPFDWKKLPFQNGVYSSSKEFAPMGANSFI